MKRHPLCELFPPMPPEQFAELVASVRERGFDPAFPIVTYEGQILDGHNRWRAAEKVGTEPVMRAYRGSDPLGFVLSANLHRRHLDESQRAMVAAKVATLSAGKPNAQIRAMTQPDAAKLLNVSRRQVQEARVVREHASPEMVTAVEQGKVAVSAAKLLARLPLEEQFAIASAGDQERPDLVKRGKQRARAIPKPSPPDDLTLAVQTAKRSRKEPAYYTVADWTKLTPTDRERIIAQGFEHGTGGMNAQTGDSIEWARWSHNTVTGCEHNCPYCYARDIAVKIYPTKFVPTFHPNRLAAPARIGFPAQEERRDYAHGNIFANSMSDLFGSWVPSDWITATLEMARRNPQWRFLTLTKFPQRAVEFEFPDNVWMGTTVDAQARVANAEKAFERIACKTKWLSLEPLLEPLTFTRLTLFKWVVIGGASKSDQTPEWVPPMDWVLALHQAARAAGCRIYYKTNLKIPDPIRPREFPWLDPKPPRLPKVFHYLKGLGERNSS